MKKIRKEDFAILNESEMNETKGGGWFDKPVKICNHMEFACCFYNYNVSSPFDEDGILKP